MASRIVRLSPQQYVHVLDGNTNITRVEVGPQTFTRMDHEEIVLGPEHVHILVKSAPRYPSLRIEAFSLITAPSHPVHPLARVAVSQVS